MYRAIQLCSPLDLVDVVKDLREISATHWSHDVDKRITPVELVLSHVEDYCTSMVRSTFADGMLGPGRYGTVWN